ncbi:hypothetical protein [Sphingomonas sp. PP-F2F-A104-K0414]|uniref:hypothetical protein n=1 Tax=Sphingomonas sp. PP-F2F-A104-K0414 TaxID=2135661 RepID=UPI001045722D|nr:hypothetical protein [Sphingomonas sp. PP-F2F-A104-K0414]
MKDEIDHTSCVAPAGGRTPVGEGLDPARPGRTAKDQNRLDERADEHMPLVGRALQNPAFAHDEFFDQALATLDELRRAVANDGVPLSEVYVEGAMGSLKHARETLVHAKSGHCGSISIDVPNAVAPLRADGLLWRAQLPEGWSDELLPERPDLGADLMATEGLREMSRGRYLGSVLATALAYHSWLHLGTGTVWSTDRGGALALIGALSGGRSISLMSYAESRGALEERVVRAIASIGWRRYRSPRYEGPVPGSHAPRASWEV